MNLFPFGVAWMSPCVDGATAGLLLRDGDLVWSSVPTVYRESDGPTLKATCKEWNMTLAGKVVSVSLEKGPEGREWLEKAPLPELAAVRFLTLPKEPDAALLPVLKRLATVNPDVSLAAGSSGVLQQALPLFRPHMLVMGDGDVVDAEARKLMADQPQIETVIVAGEKRGSLDFLPLLKGLRRLMVSDWDVEKAGPLPANLHALRSIVVFGSAMRDLSALSPAPAEVEELSVIGCTGLKDVRSLALRPGLKTLILDGGKGAPDLSSLAGLTQLQWAGLPAGTTQDQFAAFVGAHRNLKILELVGCEQVTDLAPLRDLNALEGLILLGNYKNLEVVRGLKSLRFLGLAAAAFTESPEQIAACRKALPDALVVPVSGFCLGSGWILLLFPAVALARLFAGRRRPAANHFRHG